MDMIPFEENYLNQDSNKKLIKKIKPSLQNFLCHIYESLSLKSRYYFSITPNLLV